LSFLELGFLQEAIVLKFLWILSVLGALFGGFTLISGIASANGAPQEAAAAAIAAGMAVIPYCLARAASEVYVPPKRETPKDILARS
jgi:hypothetical protein